MRPDRPVTAEPVSAKGHFRTCTKNVMFLRKPSLRFAPFGEPVHEQRGENADAEIDGRR